MNKFAISGQTNSGPAKIQAFASGRLPDGRSVRITAAAFSGTFAYDGEKLSCEACGSKAFVRAHFDGKRWQAWCEEHSTNGIAIL